MQQTWQHILAGLCTVLKQDAKIRPNAFTPQFTPEKFADVLFSLMLSALLRQDYDPSAVLEIVRSTINHQQDPALGQANQTVMADTGSTASAQ